MPKGLPLLAPCIKTSCIGYLISTDRQGSVFLLAFFNFLCCSDFTASSLSCPPSRHTTMSDISIHSSDILIFYLKCNKTNQSSVPHSTWLISESIQNYYIWQHKLKTSQPSFPPRPFINCRDRKSGHLHSGNSFHFEAASTASRQVIPDRVIKLLGHCSPPTPLPYLYPKRSERHQKCPMCIFLLEVSFWVLYSSEHEEKAPPDPNRLPPLADTIQPHIIDSCATPITSFLHPFIPQPSSLHPIPLTPIPFIRQPSLWTLIYQSTSSHQLGSPPSISCNKSCYLYWSGLWTGR